MMAGQSKKAAGIGRTTVRKRGTELNKHQVRTEQTRGKLLRSALKIFARDGFEAARLEEIAKDAGHTRGAFYAHFESKEDLFLALLEQQILKHLERARALLDAADTMPEKLTVLREYYVSRLADQNWAMLMLEFKLYAARHPEKRTRLVAGHRAIRKGFQIECLAGIFDGKQDALRGMLEAVLHSFVLQRAYDPQAFSEQQAADSLRLIFDRLVGL